MVFPEWNSDALFKALCIGTHVHKGQFKLYRAVKEVQKATPFVKNRRFILLLCQLIVNVLKLNGFRIIAIRNTTDSIRKHPLKWNRLLCCLRHTIILFGSLYNRFYFPLLLSI